jgi:hypothetical protein
MFKYELDVKSKSAITLPKDPDILIMSMTAVKNSIPDLSPAAELYDSKSKPSFSTLTVHNGKGSGQYPAGTSVTVEADPLKTGDVYWIGNIDIADRKAGSITFTMPDKDVELAALIDSYGPDIALNKKSVASGSNRWVY